MTGGGGGEGGACPMSRNEPVEGLTMYCTDPDESYPSYEYVAIECNETDEPEVLWYWSNGARRGDDTITEQCGIYDATTASAWNAHPVVETPDESCQGKFGWEGMFPVGCSPDDSGHNEGTCVINGNCCHVVSGHYDHASLAPWP
jgi:hypothetical protein